MNLLIRKAGRSILLLVVVVGAIWLLSKSVPGGFISDGDKGVLFVAVELPEGASLQRSDEVLKKAEKVVAETKGVRSVCAISGFNILTGLNMSNSALMFVGLDDWKKREAPELRAAAITRAWNQKFSAYPEARIFAFGPPALPGYGNVAGFTLQLQDRSGSSVDNLARRPNGRRSGAY